MLPTSRGFERRHPAVSQSPLSPSMPSTKLFTTAHTRPASGTPRKPVQLPLSHLCLQRPRNLTQAWPGRQGGAPGPATLQLLSFTLMGRPAAPRLRQGRWAHCGSAANTLGFHFVLNTEICFFVFLLLPHREENPGPPHLATSSTSVPNGASGVTPGQCVRGTATWPPTVRCVTLAASCRCPPS